MSQALYDLPEGWEWKRLGDVADTTSGGTPSRGRSDYWNGSIPWIKSGELGDSLIVSNSEFITEEGLKNSSAKIFVKGSLLLALYGATAGKLGILDFDAATNQAVCCITPRCDILFRDYIKYFLFSQREKIIKDSFGGAQPNISQGYVRDIIFPLPPLAEQTRIVEKLDAVLSRIDTAINELQQSLALVDAMFKSGLDKAFNPLGSPTNEAGLYDLPDGWEWKSLGNISTIGTGVTPLKGRTDFYQNGNINWVTSKATGQDFVIDSEEKITDIALSECRLKTYPIGTLIIALYGQGKTRGQVSELLIESTINQALAAVVVDTEYHVKFVKYFLKKSYLALRDKASGGTQENLNLSIVKAIQIPLPNLAEQQQVVEALDALNDKTTQLKTELTAKIGMFNQLKASVLDGAFRGEV